MADHKPLQQDDLEFKGYLTQTKKIGGRIVKEEVHIEKFDDEAVASLLNDVNLDEIEEGREALASEHPELLREGVHEMLDNAAADEDLGQEFNSAKRMASTKRAGRFMDENGETMNFRRIASGLNVEVYDDNNMVISTLSRKEFDDLLDSGEFTVL